jgi:acetyltransferase-like isoleucine patch superfamily enzyme
VTVRAALLARRAGVVAARGVRVGRGVRVQLARGARLELGEGCSLGDRTTVLVHGGTVSIGAGTTLGEGCRLVAHAGIAIGSGCVLGPQAAVMDAEQRVADPETPVRLQGIESAPVRIGDGAVLGPGAVVLAGADVPARAVLGARTITAMSQGAAGRPEHMPPTPSLEDRAALPHVAIRREITDGVRAAVDTAFPQLFATLRERGIAPAGPPFIRYRELSADGEPLALDVGVQVDDPRVAAGDALHAGELPAGRYAVLVHVGPYRSETAWDLGDAQDRMAAWIAEQGLTHRRPSELGWTVPCAVEFFRIGPVDEPDHTRWETELAWLVE